MNKHVTQVLLVTAGAFLFDLVFWQEKMALNTVLFDLFVLVALFSLYPEALRKGTVRWLLAGHLLCLAMLVVHNTEPSKIAFVITLLLLTAFAEHYHRSAWFAGGSALLNFFLMVANFFDRLQYVKAGRVKGLRLSRLFRFSFFPLALVLVFFVIYSAANEVFATIASRVEMQLENFFDDFFRFFSWQRFLFFLAGLYLTGTLLLRGRVLFFSEKDRRCRDDLFRRRRSPAEKGREALYHITVTIMGRFARGMLALKNAYTVGVISLVLLNLLLLAVNSIDISYLWFGFDFMGDVNLMQMVHEGTWLLIISIVLAMMVVGIFFKGNLNFYRHNRWLKAGAYWWIGQNAILVVSVFLRDYYYIARFGLAYRRIGVLFFLLMVLIGLVTVFLKIQYRKTGYYLWRVNAWAGIIVLVLSTTVNWDEMIAAYNLSKRDQVTLDMKFLLSLSDKTLPLLDRNRELLFRYESAVPDGRGNGKQVCATCFNEILDRRERDFLKEQQQLSWLSWNYADAVVKKYLGDGKAAASYDRAKYNRK